MDYQSRGRPEVPSAGVCVLTFQTFREFGMQLNMGQVKICRKATGRCSQKMVEGQNAVQR